MQPRLASKSMEGFVGFVDNPGEIFGKTRSVCSARGVLVCLGDLSRYLTRVLGAGLFVGFPVCFLAVARAVRLGPAFGAALQGNGIRALLSADDAGRVRHDGWW